MKQNWQRSVYLLVLKITFHDMKPLPVKKKRDHKEVIQKVAIGHGDGLIKLRQCLTEKWDYMILTNIFPWSSDQMSIILHATTKIHYG